MRTKVQLIVTEIAHAHVCERLDRLLKLGSESPKLIHPYKFYIIII